MDAHLFRRLCLNLTPLLTGARLEKVQEAAHDMLVLTAYAAKGKWQIVLRSGRKAPFCFITRQKITVGQAPSAAIMRLRKHAANRRVAACVAQWCQRRLWLLLAGGPAPGPEDADAPSRRLPWLLLDLREGPALRWLTEAEQPEEDHPEWPRPDALAAALDNWRQWPVLTPALRRTLACLEPPDQQALLEDLRVGGGDVFCYGPPVPNERQPAAVRAVSAWPLPVQALSALALPEDGGLPLSETSSPDALPLLERAGQDLVLARLADERAREDAQPLLRRERKLRRLLDKMDDEEARLTSMCAGQADALALRENLWRWPAGHRAATLAVPAGAHGPARLLRLDPRRTVREAMERLFHQARRGKRGLELLSERRAALQAELDSLRAALRLGNSAGEPAAGAATAGVPAAAPLPASLPANVQLFVSSDGFPLLRGRDAKGNLAARKLASGHDIWLHAENGPGAHVIIRRSHGGQVVPERTLDEAGALAACKSWQKDSARARIQYAEIRHVKPLRNAPPGTVRIDKALPSRDVTVDADVETRLLPT